MDKNTVVLDLKTYEELKYTNKKLKEQISKVLHDETTDITRFNCLGQYDTIYYNKEDSLKKLIDKNKDLNFVLDKARVELRNKKDEVRLINAKLEQIECKWFYKWFLK